MLTYALRVRVQLFGGSGLATASRWHFDAPLPALITVTTIFTGEWTAFFYEALDAQVDPNSATAFVVVSLLVGHFIVVNLFVAVLVDSFVQDERERRDQQDAAACDGGQCVPANGSPAIAVAPADSESAGGEGSSGGSSAPPLRLSGVTCFCLDDTSGLRRLSRTVLGHEAWRGLVLALVLASCVCLVYDDPRLDPTSELAARLSIANYALLAAFTLEAALNIIATGLICGPDSYLQNGWNRLDFAILLTSAACLLPRYEDATVVRLLRVLRPLRLVRRVPGMAVIFKFLSASALDMANVLGLVLFFSLIFAVLGLQLFIDVNFDTPELSFNNFGSSMLLLFVAATGDEWEDLMWRAMDAPAGQPGQPPIRNDSSPAAFFFILWIYVGQFVLINLFVAKVVNNFVRIKESDEHAGTSTAGALLTKEQRQWQVAMLASHEHKRHAPDPPPDPPDNPALRWLHRLVSSPGFSGFMTAVVIFNILVMASKYHGMEQDTNRYQAYSNLMWLCTHIYYTECVLKLLGLSVSGYCSDPWNRFDLFLVVLSLLDEFAAELVDQVLPLPPMLLRVLRIARVLRAVRLLKSFTGLRNVIMTLILSLPSFFNVGFLLSLVVFTFAVLGVHLFAFVGPGHSLHGARSFESVGGSAEILLQCLTGDGWANLMVDALNPPERGVCDPLHEPSDCGSPAAYAYFISFTVIGMLVLANLVVAVILQNFSTLGDLNTSLASKNDIEAFGEVQPQPLIPIPPTSERPLGHLWEGALYT